jgi:hypothetical protein
MECPAGFLISLFQSRGTVLLVGLKLENLSVTVFTHPEREQWKFVFAFRIRQS